MHGNDLSAARFFDQVRFERGVQGGSLRIENLPAARYHASLRRYSCSTLKKMLVSPAHFMQDLTRQHRPSPAMDFGSLVHLLVLEPWRLPHEYAIVSHEDASSACGRRRAQSAYPGLRLLSEVQLHSARVVAEKVLHRQVRGRPLYRYIEEGKRELTYFYQDPVTRLGCRVRLDLWHPDVLIDLKTTRHAQLGEVSRACVALSYDLQAYMYSLADLLFAGGTKAREFVFVAVQSELPHPVHVLTAGESFLANGRAKYMRALALAYACNASDYWPDNGAEVELEIQPWQAFCAEEIAGATPQPAGVADVSGEECA